MIFHEIYGRYYQAVARILTDAGKKALTGKDIRDIVAREAFAESSMVIPDALESEKWPLLKKRLPPIIRHSPTMPLTTLQKRWLKALLLDPRIRLFDPEETGLEDVTPLYTPGLFVCFDRYSDGDPYEDPGYIRRFHTILDAIRNQTRLHITYLSSRNVLREKKILPHHLEYSRKDDKFRLLAWENDQPRVFNLGRIRACTPGFPVTTLPGKPQFPQERLVLDLVDYRNTLERVMLHFSHLRKEAWRIDENHYRLALWYSKEDETELLIRVLSFGPTVKVVEPESFLLRLRERIEKQQELFSK